MIKICEFSADGALSSETPQSLDLTADPYNFFLDVSPLDCLMSFLVSKCPTLQNMSNIPITIHTSGGLDSLDMYGSGELTLGDMETAHEWIGWQLVCFMVAMPALVGRLRPLCA